MKNEELLGVNAREIFLQCKNISAEILKIANESGYQEYKEYQDLSRNFDFDLCAMKTDRLRTELIFEKLRLSLKYKFCLTTIGQAYHAGYGQQLVEGNLVWHEWRGGLSETAIFLINTRGEK